MSSRILEHIGQTMLMNRDWSWSLLKVFRELDPHLFAVRGQCQEWETFFFGQPARGPSGVSCTILVEGPPEPWTVRLMSVDLATHSMTRWRRMPSERNPSDRPSRRYRHLLVKPTWRPTPKDGGLSCQRAALRCPLADCTDLVSNKESQPAQVKTGCFSSGGQDRLRCLAGPSCQKVPLARPRVCALRECSSNDPHVRRCSASGALMVGKLPQNSSWTPRRRFSDTVKRDTFNDHPVTGRVGTTLWIASVTSQLGELGWAHVPHRDMSIGNGRDNRRLSGVRQDGLRSSWVVS